MCPLEHDDNAGGNLRADYQLPALVSRPAIYLPWVAVASNRWSTQGTPPHRHTKKMRGVSADGQSLAWACGLVGRVRARSRASNRSCGKEHVRPLSSLV